MLYVSNVVLELSTPIYSVIFGSPSASADSCHTPPCIAREETDSAVLPGEVAVELDDPAEALVCPVNAVLEVSAVCVPAEVTPA